jgi:transaldolase
LAYSMALQPIHRSWQRKYSRSRKHQKHYIDICNIVKGDVSAEVIATDYQGMIREGKELAALHPQIVVKVPATKDELKQ